MGDSISNHPSRIYYLGTRHLSIHFPGSHNANHICVTKYQSLFKEVIFFKGVDPNTFRRIYELGTEMFHICFMTTLALAECSCYSFYRIYYTEEAFLENCVVMPQSDSVIAIAISSLNIICINVLF